MQRPCLGTPGKRCGKLTTKSRCPTCQREWARGRNRAQASTYDYEWRKQSRAIRAEWIATHGYWCPGYGHQPPHQATDLVVDHDIGPCCRACNGLKAATFDRKRAAQRR